MGWAKIDDKLHSHLKVNRAWKARASIGLHLFALSYAADHETDGFIPVEFVEQKLPNERERRDAVDALLACGLWEPADDGWLIHDYLDYNPSAAAIADRRRSMAQRKQASRGRNGHASVTGESRVTTPGVTRDADVTEVGQPARVTRDQSVPRAGALARPVNDPYSPPTPPRGGNRRRRDLEREQLLYEDELARFVVNHPCEQDHELLEAWRTTVAAFTADHAGIAAFLDGSHPHQGSDGAWLIGAKPELVGWLTDRLTEPLLEQLGGGRPVRFFPCPALVRSAA